MQHLLYFGDNLDGLRAMARLGLQANLVYIDPPFATNNEFLIDTHRANSISASGEPAYADNTTGEKYLKELGDRLDAIRRVTAVNGSIYVHIDVKMEHRVRGLLDDIFGAHNFRNSITRIKCNPKNFARFSFGNIKDTILFYSMSPHQITWHPQEDPLNEDEVKTLYPRVDGEGRRYTTTPLHAPGTTLNGATGRAWRGMEPPAGRHWRYHPDKLDELDAAGLIHWSSTGNPRKINYADETAGKLPQDIWAYKDPQYPQYPTEKNSRMLDRIIRASSDPGDTVMDCYAGSGGTLVQAASLGRRFIGMDNSPAARGVITTRLSASRTSWHALGPTNGGYMGGYGGPSETHAQATSHGISGF